MNPNKATEFLKYLSAKDEDVPNELKNLQENIKLDPPDFIKTRIKAHLDDQSNIVKLKWYQMPALRFSLLAFFAIGAFLPIYKLNKKSNVVELNQVNSDSLLSSGNLVTSSDKVIKIKVQDKAKLNYIVGKKSIVGIESGKVHININDPKGLHDDTWFISPHVAVKHIGTEFSIYVTKNKTSVELVKGSITTLTHFRKTFEAPSSVVFEKKVFDQNSETSLLKQLILQVEPKKKLKAAKKVKLTRIKPKKLKKISLVLKNGDRLSGFLVRKTSTSYLIKTKHGELKVPSKNVKSTK